MSDDTTTDTMAMLERQVEAKQNYYANLLNILDHGYDGSEETELFETEFAENEGIEDYEDALERFDDSALAIDTRRTERVCFTLGGPNVFVDVEVHKGDRGGYWGADPDSATLIAAWGFESIERKLDRDDPLAQAAVRLVESKLECEV